MCFFHSILGGLQISPCEAKIASWGRPHFSSVQWTVGALPVSSSGGSCRYGAQQYIYSQEKHAFLQKPPSKTPFSWLHVRAGWPAQWFQLRFRFLPKRFRQFWFLVPVQFLGHSEFCIKAKRGRQWFWGCFLSVNSPDPPFLVFFLFSRVFLLRLSLLFWGALPFFSRIFGGGHCREEWDCLLFQKESKEREMREGGREGPTQKLQPQVGPCVILPHICRFVALLYDYCGVQKWLRIRFYYLRDITGSTLQDWVGWRILTVILGYLQRANGNSQHLEALPGLQDWLRFELFTVKITGQGPFQNN